MKNNKSIGINAALNGFRMMLSVVFPLITYPYAARVLGVENIGIVNFTSSIVSYYALVASLGITTYAVREGSMIRDRGDKLSLFSSQIFSINLCSTIVSLICFIISIIIIPKFIPYRYLMAIQGVVLIGNLLSVDWIYSIEEDYIYITIRSIIVHIVSLVLLFLFVHKEEDYIWYASTTVIANVGASIFNYIHSKKYVKFTITKNVNLPKHIKPIIILFASSITATIYVNSDKTILGFLADTYSVGLYSISVNVYSVSKAIFSAVMLAVLPRLSYYIFNNKINEYDLLSRKLLQYLFTLVIPVMWGIVLTSKDIIYIVGGAKYLEASTSLSILAVALVFSVFAIYITNVVLLPFKMESVNLKASIISALLNIGLNMILLKDFRQNGAAFTTLLAELFIFLFELYHARIHLKISLNYKLILSVFVGCIGIFLSVLLIDIVISFFWVGIFLKIFCSVLVYFGVLFVFKNEVIMDILSKINTRIRN